MPISVHPATEIIEFYPPDDRSPQQKFGEYLNPYFEIEIVDKRDNFFTAGVGVINSQNRSFLDRRLVEDVMFEEDIESADQIKITLLNPELRMSDLTIFSLGNSVDLFMGYDGRPRMYMGRGIITGVDKDFNDTKPTIVLTAHDISYFMMEEEKADIDPDGSRWWTARRAEHPSASDEPAAHVIEENIELPIVPDDPSDPLPVMLDTYEQRRSRDIATAARERNNASAPMIDTETGRTIPTYTVRLNTVATDGPTTIRDSVRHDREHEISRRIQLSPIAANTSTARPHYEQRPVGRRRKAGHVWSGLSDSDIVIAIFRKYDIWPYVEITGESRSRRAEDHGDDGDDGDHGGDDTGDDIVLPDVPDDPSDPHPPVMLDTYEQRRTRDMVGARRSNMMAPTLYIHGLDQPISPRRRRGINWFDPDIVNRPYSNEYLAEENMYMPRDTPPVPLLSESSRQQDTRRRVVQKAGTTDWEFLQELSKKHGFLCFVFFDYESRHWIGYWGPEENIPSNREFLFRYNAGALTSIKSFKPSTSTKGQSTEVNLIYVDPISRHENRLRVNIERGATAPASAIRESENRDPIGNGPEVVLDIAGERTTINANHRFTSSDDALRWLIAYWRRYASDFQLVEGESVIGIPEIRARQTHQFLGVRSDSGRYFITVARHSMNASGYTTSFTCRKKVDELTDRSETTIEVEDMNQPAIDPTLALPSDVA